MLSSQEQENKSSKGESLQFPEFVKNIQGELGKTEWITVFNFFGSREKGDSGTFFSAIISQDKIKNVLEKYEWDLTLDGGRPGFVTYYKGGESETKYYRFSDEGIEPLLYWRTYTGRKATNLEVIEEFRLYFNLFETVNGNEKIFTFTNDDGAEDDVIKIGDEKVEIKLKYLKEFLAAKNSVLALYFEAMRLLPETLGELGLQESDHVEKTGQFTYSLCVRSLDLGNTKSQGWLLGKKIVLGQKDFKPNFWGAKEDEKYEEFIIGTDEDGKYITSSCNTDYQASPNFLTPIFFRREVLKKYYDNPEKYTVGDGSLSRDGFWSLRMMNNHPDHVVVWLGDLKSLPNNEQKHWREYNLSPTSRKISHTDFARNLEAKFEDPDYPELYFKYRLESFQEAWVKSFGWNLFLPLSEEDSHHLKTLHIPTTKDQKEFDDQISSIVKITIDSINVSELSKITTLDKERNGTIDWLEAFIESRGLSYRKMIEFFRKLQALRSSSIAHRKGDKYEDSKKYFEIGKKDFSKIFEEIVIKWVWAFNTLEKAFVKDNQNNE